MSRDSQEMLALDDDMSSWSSAFDPVTPPLEAPENKRKTKKKKKSGKKKRDKRDNEGRSRKKKKQKRASSSDSSATGALEGVQQTLRQNLSGNDTPEQEDEASATLPPSFGRWVFQAFWEVTEEAQPPYPLPKRRVAAKMLVRAGLRCKCHFALIAECPLSRQRAARVPAYSVAACHTITCFMLIVRNFRTTTARPQASRFASQN